MHRAHAQKQVDWLSACRRAATAMRAMFADRATTVERAREMGSTGVGGDLTLEIDHAAEEIVFAELRTLHEAGSRFSAISEERGAVDFGGGEVLVVIDPIDGSLNAKRGIAHHALSVAVARGTTMADVEFGFVYEFGTCEEWSAQRGAGAFLNGARLDREASERRTVDGRLEMLGIESADPRWLQGTIDSLADRAYRLRAFGALAPSLCQVAASRLDALMSLRNCRAVDVAAAQLIVEEAGGRVGFPMFEDPLAAPLDLAPHSPIVAARTASTLADLEALCRPR